MSISRTQASALAEGFLDDLGSEEGIMPRETFTELILLGGELVETTQENLEKDKSNSRGKLSTSIILSEPVMNGNMLSCNMEMSFYGEFINSGVRGTKSGSGKYKFKSPYPSTNMVKALAQSIGRAKKKTRNTNNRTTSGNEKKNLKLSNIQKAYGAGRNIKMYGIKATGFIDKAVQETAKKVQDRLGAAFSVDVLNSIG